MPKTCKAAGCGNTWDRETARFDKEYCGRRCLLRMASRRRRARGATVLYGLYVGDGSGDVTLPEIPPTVNMIWIKPIQNEEATP